MYCKNCGSEVNDKAIACPKCGVNPHSQKNFCQSCGRETNPNQIMCTNCGVSLRASGGETPDGFPVPLVAGYLINMVAWVIFVVSFNDVVEFIMGLFCVGAAFIGYMHKKNHTVSVPSMEFLTPERLIYISIFDAVWIMIWAFA